MELGDNKLAVEGRIAAKKVRVTQMIPWPDYVFQPGYKLKTLKDVEQFISEHGHPPDILSAEDVEENGLDLPETNASLLKKIEELTLYVIEMRKEIDELKKKQCNHRQTSFSWRICQDASDLFKVYLFVAFYFM